MPCCSTGRDTKKLVRRDVLNLQTITDSGNTTSHSIEIGGNLDVSGYLIGDGSQLSNLSGQGTVTPTLQQVTTRGSTTNDTVTFSNPMTSFETSGNVSVTGNVTASIFYGDGSNITSVASQSDFDDNSSRIDTLAQKTIITNTMGITSDFSKGDLLYAPTHGNLSNLGISATQGSVLTAGSSGVPEWGIPQSSILLDSRLSSLESNIIITSTDGISSFTKGDILYASATDTLSRLPKGNTGQFLAINSSGLPEWVNGPTQTTNFITESYPSSGFARVGIHNTNPLHSISFGTSYYEDNPGTYSNLVVNGNVYGEYLYGNGAGITNLGGSGTSDIRIKSNVIVVKNSLDALSKLNPVMYEKDGRVETGFIAQDIYYDAPELRHLVQLGKDANPNETKNEPNYEDWGKEHAKLDYYSIMTYTVAAINELREMVEDLENA
jgi:hypothetical protein